VGVNDFFKAQPLRTSLVIPPGFRPRQFSSVSGPPLMSPWSFRRMRRVGQSTVWQILRRPTALLRMTVLRQAR